MIFFSRFHDSNQWSTYHVSSNSYNCWPFWGWNGGIGEKGKSHEPQRKKVELAKECVANSGPYFFQILQICPILYSNYCLCRSSFGMASMCSSKTQKTFYIKCMFEAPAGSQCLINFISLILTRALCCED